LSIAGIEKSTKGDILWDPLLAVRGVRDVPGDGDGYTLAIDVAAAITHRLHVSLCTCHDCVGIGHGALDCCPVCNNTFVAEGKLVLDKGVETLDTVCGTISVPAIGPPMCVAQIDERLVTTGMTTIEECATHCRRNLESSIV